MPDVPDAHLSSLHGLALEIRRDNDVSSLSFCILFYFFSFAKRNSTQRAGVCPAGSGAAGGPSRAPCSRHPGEEAAAETPPRHSTPSVQSNPEGGEKPKKHFCSLTSCPDSQVHTSAWKLRAWKTQNPRHKRSGLRRFRSAWRGRRQCLGAVPGWAERICSSAAAGLDDPWAGATGKYGSWGGGDALGQTRRWLHVAVEGVWGLFVGVFILLGAWGYFIIIFYFFFFFLSRSLSFISPQTVVSGKLLLIFKRQREE